MFVSGRGLTERDERGNLVEDDDLLLLLNAHHDDVPFTLPGARGTSWDPVVDTDRADGVPDHGAPAAGDVYPLRGRSAALFCAKRRTG